MNRKGTISSLAIIFIIISLSFISVVNADTKDSTPNDKVSPLYKVRTENAIKEKIGELKTNYLGNRIFILPNLNLLNFYKNEDGQLVSMGITCQFSACIRITCNLFCKSRV